MSLPRKLIPSPRVEGIQGIKSETVDLLPANGSSATTYSPTGNNRVIFNIPAYPHGWLNAQKSFMKFKVKSNGADYLMRDGVPIFNRLVLKASNGIVLEDIQDYDVLEKVFNLVKDSSTKDVDSTLEGDYGEAIEQLVTAAEATTFNGLLAIEFSNGKTYLKKLLSGVIGAYQSAYVPLNLMAGNGGYALQMELYMNPAESCMKQTVSGTGPTPSYTVDNLQLQLEVLTMSPEICDKFNSAICGGQELVLPFNSFRSHIHTHSTGTKTQVYINENVTDLQRLWTVIRASAPGFGAEYDFIGGSKHTGGVKVSDYQYRYGTSFKPLAKCEVGERSSVVALANLMSSINSLVSGTPFLAKNKRTTTNARYDNDAFVLCQSFEYSEDDFKNGLNTTSSGAPVQLEINWSQTTDNKILTTFVESGFSLVISKDGFVSLVDKKMS